MESDMYTGRRKLLKVFYPLIMAVGRLFRRGIRTDGGRSTSPVSFYSLKTLDNHGADILFDQFRGRKVLLVNTASDCGFTPQYHDLQELYNQYRGSLDIIAFPANDFGEQEKGNDEEIAQFCQLNYAVDFPLAKKSTVIKGPDQNSVFQWLTDKTKNGWNDRPPAWNFSKYLIDEQGRLTHCFDSAVSPLSHEVLTAVRG